MENVQIERRRGVASPRRRLEELLSGGATGLPLIDIGTTSLTGLQKAALPDLPGGRKLTNPIYQTVALEAGCLEFAADFIRAGFLFDVQPLTAKPYRDVLGVEWLYEDGYLAPYSHPLEKAGINEVKVYPKPRWNLPVQEGGAAGGKILVADAPCPGLLDTCFLLRGGWQFMEDISAKSRIVPALLEWSLEEIIGAYEGLLSSLKHPPDLLIYNDDLGFRNSMFFSPADFRLYILPYLGTLLTHLRKLCKGAVCFHSCGAISPILKDIAELGFEILNLDPYARGMEVKGLRSKLPKSVILHGFNDLCALGEVLAKQDKAGIAYFITELAQSWPVIAGPADSLASEAEVTSALRGAALIRNLSAEDFENLRRFGPVRSIIENALVKTWEQDSDNQPGIRNYEE